MLRYALLLVLLAVIAAVLGFAGVLAEPAWVARLLFFAFLGLAGVALLVGALRASEQS
jgi:uncharacterized membrane protein YtjA (UPF0391 family)